MGIIVESHRKLSGGQGLGLWNHGRTLEFDRHSSQLHIYMDEIFSQLLRRKSIFRERGQPGRIAGWQPALPQE